MALRAGSEGSAVRAGREHRAGLSLRLLALLVLFLVGGAGCGGVLFKEYEYDEQVDLALDGSAIVDVNASIPALVALQGADLDVNPRARLDRNRIRAMYEGPGPGARVIEVTSFRRHGRRFVHVRAEIADIRQLPRVAPFSWSRYRLDRVGDAYQVAQDVGPSADKPIGDVGWDGRELVAFRMHLPSRIRTNNALEENFKRGNILVWEQALKDRRAGAPLHMEASMDTQTILSRTLVLFAGTLVSALAMVGLVIWWVAR